MPRPFSITLLAWAALALALFNGAGAYSGLSHYSFLTQLPLAVAPLYLILSRLVWAVVWLGLAVGLWRFARWARVGVLVGSGLYFAHGWLNYLWFRSDYAFTTIPCALTTGLIGLALVWGIVWRAYRKSET